MRRPKMFISACTSPAVQGRSTLRRRAFDDGFGSKENRWWILWQAPLQQRHSLKVLSSRWEAQMTWPRFSYTCAGEITCVTQQQNSWPQETLWNSALFYETERFTRKSIDHNGTHESNLLQFLWTTLHHPIRSFCVCNRRNLSTALSH